ncbi:MAG: hypothetical protein OXI65_06615 [Acidobacteriota bacterium]|nr:hypothetical protein [Acidobacteriota bacterium]
MRFAITIRGLNPSEMSWLKAEARKAGISMAEFVRRIIRRQRERNSYAESAADLFRRHFGPEYGVELPPRQRSGYRPVELPRDEAPTEDGEP